RRLGVERASGRQAPPLPQWGHLSISYTLLFPCPMRSVLASSLSLLVPRQYKALTKACPSPKPHSLRPWVGSPFSCRRRSGGARPSSRGRVGDGRRTGRGGVEAGGAAG